MIKINQIQQRKNRNKQRHEEIFRIIICRDQLFNQENKTKTMTKNKKERKENPSEKKKILQSVTFVIVLISSTLSPLFFIFC